MISYICICAVIVDRTKKIHRTIQTVQQSLVARNWEGSDGMTYSEYVYSGSQKKS